MKRQNGAALVVVLSLLAISLMVGLSSMQASQVDERLAGNYKAHSEAQMKAEFAMSEAVALFLSSGSYDVNVVADMQEVKEAVASEGWGGLQSYNSIYTPSSNVCEEKSCAYGFFEDEVGGIYAISLGAVFGASNEMISESESIVVGLSSGGFPFPLIGNAYNVIDEYEFSSSANADATEWEEKIASNPNLFDEDVATTPREFLDYIELVKRAYESGDYDNVYYFDSDPGKLSNYDGLVVINDNFDWNGRNDFQGLLIVLGRIFDYNGAGAKGYMEGAVLHVPTSDSCSLDVAVDCEFTTPEIEVAGGVGGFRYDENVLNNLKNSLGGGGAGSPSVVSWQ